MVRKLLALAVLCSLTAGLVLAQDKEKEELADNPFYKAWAGYKVNSTVVQSEKIKYGPNNPDGKYVPGGVDHKDIAYKLIQITKDKAVVETRVTDYDLLSTVETAPTRITYPARVKKSYVDEIKDKLKPKITETTAKFKGKEYKVSKVEITKESDGVTTSEVSLYCETVPGGLIRKMITTKKGGELLSESTTTLLAYAIAAEPKPKDKAKDKDDKPKDKPKESKDKPKDPKDSE